MKCPLCGGAASEKNEVDTFVFGFDPAAQQSVTVTVPMITCTETPSCGRFTDYRAEDIREAELRRRGLL